MSLPDTLALSLNQACPHCAKPVPIIEFRFPTTMYLPSGQLEHRLIRSRFLKQMADLFDEQAESGRQKCIESDPLTVRPPLEKLGMTIIDTSAIAQPMEWVASDDAPTAQVRVTGARSIECFRPCDVCSFRTCLGHMNFGQAEPEIHRCKECA